MSSSLYSGISGLNAMQTQLDVIGNNIANANTVGYKSSRILFSDILSQSLTGGGGGTMQVGRGVSVGGVDTLFSAGSFETTSNATDLSIDGEGFFMVRDAEGGIYYTRAGAFSVDNEGYLVDVNNHKVQGCNLMAADSDAVTDISLKDVQSAPKATTETSIGANLDASTPPGDVFTVAQEVYDTLGTSHTLRLEFEKQAAAGGWSARAVLVAAGAGETDIVHNALDPADYETAYVADGEAYAEDDLLVHEGVVYRCTSAYTSATGDDCEPEGSASNWEVSDYRLDEDGVVYMPMSFEFAADGSLTSPSTDPTLSFAGLANGAEDIDVNWKLTGSGVEPLTGYASTSVVKSLIQDGYSSGELRSISVTEDGIITGFFTNGQTTSIGEVMLATFSNPLGLQRMGANLFGETLMSGVAIQNSPGTGGMGTIISNSLELSNADIAQEFINMITAQRAYQASAKVVSTTDQMMSELMNVKR